MVYLWKIYCRLIGSNIKLIGIATGIYYLKNVVSDICYCCYFQANTVGGSRNKQTFEYDLLAYIFC